MILNLPPLIMVFMMSWLFTVIIVIDYATLGLLTSGLTYIPPVYVACILLYVKQYVTRLHAVPSLS